MIDPELEVWVWSGSSDVDVALGWPHGALPLSQWLVQKGYLEPGGLKPRRPKEAVEKALEISGTMLSSSLYRELARKVSFQHCPDPAFLKLTSTLQRWFPA